MSSHPLPPGVSRWQLFPLLRIALFMLCGVVCGNALYPSVNVWLWLTALIVQLSAAFVCRRWAVAQSFFILAGSFCVGALMVSERNSQLNVEYVNAPVEYEGVVLTEPVVHGKVVMFDMFVAHGSYQGCKLKASLLCDTVQRRYERLHVGDGIVAASVVEPPSVLPGATFDYALYLRVHGFVGTTFIY